MDSDTMRTPGSHEAVLSAFKAGEVDILLGTQMIAKGLDFPNVTLVGVVNADTALHMPDFRAGRADVPARGAGRGPDRPGRPAGQGAGADLLPRRGGDRLRGAPRLRGVRRRANCPSASGSGCRRIGRLVRVIARGPDETAVRDYLERSAAALLPRRRARAAESALLGPAPAPVLKIRNLYRYHLRLVADGPKPLQDLLLGETARTVPPPPGVELAIDVDPVSML